MTLLNYKNQDHYESKVTQKETQLVLMTRGCGGKKRQNTLENIGVLFSALVKMTRRTC